METIFITGVSGFLGSHIAEKALENQYRVVGIDLETEDPIKKFNLSFLSSPHFSFIKSSVTDVSSISKLLLKYKPRILIHCAARINVRKSINQSHEYFYANTYGTTVLLEALRQHSPKTKSIVFSSSSVYGKQDTVPFQENMTLSPQSPYALSKKLMEEVSTYYHRYYNLPIILVRPFSIYGPRSRLDMAPMLLIRSAELNVPFAQFGDNKTNMRDWTYIDDFTFIVSKFFTNFQKYNGEIINIGSSSPVGIDDFVSIMQKLSLFYFNKTVTITKKTVNPIEMPITYADISRIKQIIPNFKPLKIEKGLEKMFKFYTKNRSFYRKLFIKTKDTHDIIKP